MKIPIPRIGVRWKVTLRGPDGKVKEVKTGQNSFVKAWAQYIRGLFTDANESMTDITNTVRTINYSNRPFYIVAPPIGNITYGIVAGTGSGAVAYSDYALGAIINHGTGSGNLYYNLGSKDADVTESGSPIDTAEWSMQRVVCNNSGATITINEIGLYGYSGTYTFCFIRDVIGGGVAVADLDTLEIEYTFQFLLSNGWIRNGWVFIVAMMSAITTNLKDTSNASVTTTTIRTNVASASWLGTNPSTQSAYGILIGSNNTAVAYDNYDLGSELSGTYEQEGHNALGESGGVIEWEETRRYINNVSGISQDVKEIGLVIGTGATYIMIARWVVSTITLADNDRLDVTVNIKFNM